LAIAISTPTDGSSSSAEGAVCEGAPTENMKPPDSGCPSAEMMR
jgi:hypothetical protein